MANSLKERLQNSFPGIITVLVIAIWIVGAVHGTKKHNAKIFTDDFLYCWYYGIEGFFHKSDYAELNDLVKSTSMFIVENNMSSDTESTLKNQTNKKLVIKSLSNLSNKEKLYVKNGVVIFKDWFANSCRDFANTINTFNNNPNLNVTFSPVTSSLYKKGEEYNLTKIMDEINSGMESNLKQLSKSMPLDENTRDLILNSSEERLRKIDTKSKELNKEVENIFY